MTPEQLGEEFEKEWSNKTDYFNHRIGVFMEMKNWIIKKSKLL